MADHLFLDTIMGESTLFTTTYMNFIHSILYMLITLFILIRIIELSHMDNMVSQKCSLVVVL